MISTAKLTQHVQAPLQGVAVSLLILATSWLVGLPSALGFSRPMSIPVAIVIVALLGRWLLKPMIALAVVMMIAAAVGIWSPIVPRLAQPFVRNDRVDLERVDAVFVFSGSVNSAGLLTGEVIDRLLTGIALRARRPALPLLVSIVRVDQRIGSPSSFADQQSLIAMVPASGPVEWIDSVYSTRDEAVRLSRRAFEQRWKRVAVVTSPMHSRRACATVEGMGLAVTCVVAPWRPAAWPARSAGDRILVMQRLVYETLAWAQYRVSGWATWA